MTIRKLLKKKKEAKESRKKIEEYFELAKSINAGRKADDYIRKARNLAMKYRIKMPAHLKRRFCKHCYAYLIPGKNLRVRLQNGKIVCYCLKCRKFTRIPYRNRNKK